MKTGKKIQEENEQAIRWVKHAGIMAATDPQRAVTQEELAGILHRTLEYFFVRLIAAVEDC